MAANCTANGPKKSTKNLNQGDHFKGDPLQRVVLNVHNIIAEHDSRVKIPEGNSIIWDSKAYVYGVISYVSVMEDPSKWEMLFKSKESLGGSLEADFGVTKLVNQVKLNTAIIGVDDQGISRHAPLHVATTKFAKIVSQIRHRLAARYIKVGDTSLGDFTCALLCKLYGVMIQGSVTGKVRKQQIGSFIVDAYLQYRLARPDAVMWRRKLTLPDDLLQVNPHFVSAYNQISTDLVICQQEVLTDDDDDDAVSQDDRSEENDDDGKKNPKFNFGKTTTIGAVRDCVPPEDIVGQILQSHVNLKNFYDEEQRLIQSLQNQRKKIKKEEASIEVLSDKRVEQEENVFCIKELRRVAGPQFQEFMYATLRTMTYLQHARGEVPILEFVLNKFPEVADIEHPIFVLEPLPDPPQPILAYDKELQVDGQIEAEIEPRPKEKTVARTIIKEIIVDDPLIVNAEVNDAAAKNNEEIVEDDPVIVNADVNDAAGINSKEIVVDDPVSVNAEVNDAAGIKNKEIVVDDPIILTDKDDATPGQSKEVASMFDTALEKTLQENSNVKHNNDEKKKRRHDERMSREQGTNKKQKKNLPIRIPQEFASDSD